MDSDKACRACEIAFWQAHGMTVEAAERYGLDPGGSLVDAAWMSTVELSSKALAQPDRHVGLTWELTAQGPDKVDLSAFGFEPEPTKRRRLFREVLMLAPGRFNSFDFTDAHLRNCANNFSKMDNPPILIDHEVSAKNLLGWIRGLRYEPGWDEDSSRLLGLWEFLGEEACSKVEDGVYKRISGSFLLPKEPSEQRVLEGSIVVRGAYDRGPFDRAQILGGETTMSVPKAAAAAQSVSLSTAAPATKDGNNPNPAPEAQPEPAPAAPAASPEPAPVALSADSAQVLQLLQQVVSNQQALSQEVKDLKEERSQRVALERKALDDQAYQDLVRLGKSAPALKDKELKILSELPPGARESYLELRRELPNVWPAQPRQSGVVNLTAPGQEPDESQEMLKLAKKMGLPVQTAEGGGQ
jgi:hypothetical protein